MTLAAAASARSNVLRMEFWLEMTKIVERAAFSMKSSHHRLASLVFFEIKSSTRRLHFDSQ